MTVATANGVILCSSVLLLFLFSLASAGRCYDECEKVFELQISTPRLPMCDNSFIMKQQLNGTHGLFGIPNTNPSWWLPDGRNIYAVSNSALFSQYNNKLKRKSGNVIFFPGIYTYSNSISAPRLIGIYDSTNEALLVNVQANLIVHNYVRQSGALHLDCCSQNYPPTCLTWSNNGNELSVSSTTVVLSNSSTIYSSSVSISLSEIEAGNYSCTVITNGTILFENSDHVFIEDSPVLQTSSLRLISEDTLRLEWEHHGDIELASVQFIYYQEVDSDDAIVNVSCDGSMACDISELKSNTTYYIVIETMRSNNKIFLPSNPYNITIKEPDPIEKDGINISLRDDQPQTAFIKWTPVFLQNSTNISYSASCHMEVCMSGWTISTGNSTDISDLIEGLNYTVSLVAMNPIGSSLGTEVTLIQDQEVPLLSPVIILDQDSINSSSFSISWEPLSCCMASGEIPSYTITLTDTSSSTILHNITVTDSFQYNFTELEPNTEYRIEMSAYNSIGYSQADTQSVETHPEPIIATSPTAPSDAPPTTAPFSGLLLYITIGTVALVMIVAIGGCCLLACCCIMRSCNKRGPGTRMTKMDTDSIDYTSPNYVPLKPLQQQELQKCEKPYVLEFPTDTKAVEGESVYFLVRIAGYPEPSYSWQFQGEPIASQGEFQIFSDGSLIISNIRAENTGQYVFNARNVGGVLNRFVNLDVVCSDEDDTEKYQLQAARTLIINQKPIPVDALEKYVEMQHSSENSPFTVLYTSLHQATNQSMLTANANSSRNRYKNIVPYDSNLVQLDSLENWEQFQNTYINASYIDGYEYRNKFIATQAPLPNTIGDFWRMIWKEKCSVIVMLTNKIEGNRVKCGMYWPVSDATESDLQIGPYVIQLIDEEAYANFVIRSFNILLTDGSQSTHQLKQFHYTAWPDHGVPDHGSPLVLFHQKIMNYHSTRGGPIVTHCSAGVGRTGTFIALDIALDQVKSESQVDPVGIVNRLREQRMKMVQTCAQFIFLHDTLLEQVLCGNTLISVANLSRSISVLDCVSDDNTRKTGFETQFQLIQRVTPKVTDYKCDKGKEHVDKNRPNTPLPIDKRRVVLKGHEPDYISATYVDGYQQKKEFIIAQSPLPQTTADFWRMVVQHKSSTIVMLCNLSENFKVVCHRYWPVGTDIADVFEHFSVKLINEVQESDAIIRRTLGIKDMNSGLCTTVVHLQVTNWLSDGQCANHCTIGQLYNLVTDNQRRSGSRPIVVHCSDALTRSAMYCVTHNAIEQSKLEHACDIFQIVKSLRMQRPGAIPLLHHYQTVHELASSYLCSFAMYSQFQ